MFVAISMVVMLGFASFGVDAAALWSDQKQVQNGADAGALAIAQTCASDPANCASAGTTANSMATQYAIANKVNGASGNTTGVAQIDSANSTVTVTASTNQSLWFAKVLGMNNATVAAKATAKWGPISGGTFVPLTISLCAFYAQSDAIVGDPIQTDSPMTIYYGTALSSALPISQDPTGICGTGSGGTPPGGFNWVGNQDHNCTASVLVGDWMVSQPGNVPKGCNFGTSLAGQTIQIPVFDAVTGTGSNAEYHIYAIASFLITAYCFHPNDNQYPLDAKCVGDLTQHYISGYFVNFTAVDQWTTSSGGPNVGTAQVFLTN